MKVLLIIPYFGKVNDDVDKSLNSLIINNPKLDVLFITDDLSYKINNTTSNLKLINITVFELSKIVHSKLKVSQNFASPYKLCDFKIFYPIIFADLYNSNYDYVGFCDVDALYGDVFSFIEDSLFGKIDVIGNRGHLTLFNMKFYDRFVENGVLKSKLLPSLNKILSASKVFAIDEFDFFHKIMRNLVLQHGASWACDVSNACIDLNYFEKKWVCNNRKERVCVVRNVKEKLFIVNADSSQEEIPYIHFQKRAMPINIFVDSFKYTPEYKFSNFSIFRYKTFIFFKRIKSKFTSESFFRKKIYSHLWEGILIDSKIKR